MKSKNRRQNKEVSGVRQRATVTKGISSLNWQKRLEVWFMRGEINIPDWKGVPDIREVYPACLKGSAYHMATHLLKSKIKVACPFSYCPYFQHCNRIWQTTVTWAHLITAQVRTVAPDTGVWQHWVPVTVTFTVNTHKYQCVYVMKKNACRNKFQFYQYLIIYKKCDPGPQTFLS